jgi:hypothetical protein
MPTKRYTAKVKRSKKPTNPRLKAYLDTSKNESILLGPVARYLQDRPDPRRSDVIHPSEMAKAEWCPRATWHRLSGHTAKLSAPDSLRANLIFAEGHDIHHKWQRWLREMGILWGYWECSICAEGMYEWSDNLIPGHCLHGSPHNWKYREVPLRSTPLGIQGHADGITNPTADETFMLEAKSVGPGTLRKLDLIKEDEEASSQFSKITRPLGDHFRQLQIYLRLFNEDERLTEEVGAIRRGLMIYEHKADQQVREFPVVYNPRWTDELFSTAQDIIWAVDHDRTIGCPYGGCSQCKPYESED